MELLPPASHPSLSVCLWHLSEEAGARCLGLSAIFAQDGDLIYLYSSLPGENVTREAPRKVQELLLFEPLVALRYVHMTRAVPAFQVLSAEEWSGMSASVDTYVGLGHLSSAHDSKASETNNLDAAELLAADIPSSDFEDDQRPQGDKESRGALSDASPGAADPDSDLSENAEPSCPSDCGAEDIAAS